MQLIVKSAVAFLFAVTFTYFVRKIAKRLKIVAAPRVDRWHQSPTALLGGVAIVCAFGLSILVFASPVPGVIAVFVSALLLSGVGFLDDLYEVKPYIKLVFQLIAASFVVAAGIVLPWTASEVVNALITTFWLVGITNAVNLLDNMDGLAGGISFIAAIFLAVTFVVNGQYVEAEFAALLAGAVLGFLVYNFSPASIFMGDCGSMFLGFSLGGLALLSEYGRTRNLTSVFLTPVLILLIPIFDTCLVTLNRRLAGRPVTQGGRDHSSHRLVALGISEKKAVIILYVLATISGAFVLLLRWLSPALALLAVPAFALAVLSIGIYLSRVAVYQNSQEAKSPTLRVLVDFGYKRRVFEVLLDVLLIAISYYGAYLLRWDGEIPSAQLGILVSTMPVVIAVELGVFLAMGLYRGLWRYTGIGDLFVIGRAACLGSLAGGFAVLALYGFVGPSRGALVVHCMLLLLLQAASRVSFRLLRAFVLRMKQVEPDSRPTIIYGAGDGGELLIREMMNGPGGKYRLVGLLDDDDRKIGKFLHGFRIYNSDELPRLIETLGVSQVVVSSAKVSETKVQRVRSLGVDLRRMSVRIE